MPVGLIIILSVFGGLTLLACAIFIHFYLKRSRRAIQQVADRVGSPIQTRWSNGAAVISGRYKNCPFTCTYTPPHKSTPPYLIVALKIPQQAVFSIRRRNRFDKFCGRFGFTRPMSTDDPGFDDRFHIDTADPGEAVKILGQKGYRHRIEAFFELPTAEIAYSREGISVKQRREPKDQVHPETVAALLDDLAVISRPTDRTTLRFADAPLSGTAIRMRIGSPLVLLMFTGLALSIIGMEAYPTLYPSFWDVAWQVLPWVAAASAGYLLLAWLFAGHRTDRHMTIGMVLLLVLPAFYPATVGGLYTANGFLDHSRAVEMRGTVHSTYIQGRGGRKIRFTVDDRRTAGFDRPRGDFPRGLPVRLTVRDGYFGYPWVENWRALKTTSGIPSPMVMSGIMEHHGHYRILGR